MLHCLHAYFAALDPRLWGAMACSVRASEGWRPSMNLVAVMGVVGFGGAFVRSSFVATACLYAWAACWAAVFSIASTLALTDSLRNLVRFRLRGYTRPRFWFEIARSSCILGALFALVAFPTCVCGLPDSMSIGVLLLNAIACFITVFFIASTFGYILTLITGRRVTGRAIQCVAFFFPFCLAMITIGAFLYSSSRLFDDPLWGLATLAAICVAGAIALTLMQRWRGVAG